MIPYTLSEAAISFFLRGRQYTFASDDPRFDNIIEGIINNDEDFVEEVANPKQAVKRVTLGTVIIDNDDRVYCYGVEVSEFLARRIINQYNKFSDNPKLLDPLIKFTEKLSLNPNSNVRDDLFEWLDRGSMPLYPDGDFAAYKLVKSDFSPIHSGPYGQDQSPGTVVSMPREACDSDRDATCSRGLHFCSYEYLPIFQQWNSNLGQKVILLKINPANVVAIPRDYNLSKGRTCEFYVVEEIDPVKIKEHFGDLLVLTHNDVKSESVFGDEDTSVYETDINQGPKEKYYKAKKALEEANGVKTHAAASLGISRSTLSRWLNDYEPDENTRRAIAETVVSDCGGNKTAAAKKLGISRSALYRWLAE